MFFYLFNFLIIEKKKGNKKKKEKMKKEYDVFGISCLYRRRNIGPRW